MCRKSEYVRLRLLSFYRSNVKISKAVQELSAEGLKVNRKTVAKYYSRYKRDLPLGDLPRSGFRLLKKSLFSVANQFCIAVFTFPFWLLISGDAAKATELFSPSRERDAVNYRLPACDFSVISI